MENAQIQPISAHTGKGLDNLRSSLAAALGRRQPQPQPLTLSSERHPPSTDTHKEPSDQTFQETGDHSALPGESPGTEGLSSDGGVGVRSETDFSETEDEEGGDASVEVCMAEAPENAATATVLDYTSSAKTGKVMVSADRICCISYLNINVAVYL